MSHYVTGNGNVTAAARKAGYKDAPKSGYVLMRNPAVQSAIRAARLVEINGEGVSLAWQTIKGLMTDDDTPKHVKFQAARYTMEIAGYGQKAEKQGDDKPLSEMTDAELQDYIRRKKDLLDALPTAQAIEIESESMPMSLEDTAQ